MPESRRDPWTDDSAPVVTRRNAVVSAGCVCRVRGDAQRKAPLELVDEATASNAVHDHWVGCCIDRVEMPTDDRRMSGRLRNTIYLTVLFALAAVCVWFSMSTAVQVVTAPFPSSTPPAEELSCE